MKGFQARAIVLLAAAAVLLVSARPAPASITSYCVADGGGSPPSLSTNHRYNPLFGGWLIGPVTVDTGDPGWSWNKELRSPLRGWPGQNNTYNLLEVIRVSDGPGLTGWHEQVKTDGWDWVSGSIYAYSTAGFKLLDIGDITSDGGNIDFAFDPQYSNILLFIYKTITWTDDGKPKGPINVTETLSAVPIPGALWLLASGLVGLVAIRRRRNS